MVKRGRGDKGNLFPEMASKYRSGQEEERQMESLHRFHRLEPSMPKGPVPYAKDRSIGRRHIWAPEDEFPGCHSGLSSNFPSCRGPREDDIHLPRRQLLLDYDRATYQRMMTRMFQDMIRCTVEVYIDDMVVKSKLEARNIEDI